MDSTTQPELIGRFNPEVHNRLTRIQLIDQVYKLSLLSTRPTYLSEQSGKRASVKNSVVDNFDDLFMEYTRNSGGYLSTHPLKIKS